MDIGDIIMVGGSSRIPLVIEMVFTHFDLKQLCLRINPDGEAVSYELKIYAAIFDKTENVRQI